MGKLADSPLDPTARAVADRLHGASKKEMIRSAAPALTKMVKHRFREGTWDNTQSEDGKAFLADNARPPQVQGRTLLLAVPLTGCAPCGRGRHLVRGVDDLSRRRCARQRRRHRRDRRGLRLGYTQILSGDLRETLPDVDGPIDFMLVDIWIPMALPALKAVEPKLPDLRTRPARAVPVGHHPRPGRRRSLDEALTPRERHPSNWSAFATIASRTYCARPGSRSS